MGASSCIRDYQDAIREDFKKGNKVQWKTHKCKAYTGMVFVWYTHQNLFAKPFVQDIVMSFPGRGLAYHSQVFRSPNPLNGEQLTCSKAACEGGGTVLRFNCPIVESLAWFVQSQLFRESEWTSPGNSSMLDIWTKCPDQMHIS